MPEADRLERFEAATLPHLDAAFNLARWIVRNDQDAQDVVQESYLRAFRFFDTYQGGEGRAWLLAIVRNASKTWLRKSGRIEAAEFEEQHHSRYCPAPAPGPEQQLVERANADSVRQCIELLPAEYKEALVMREMEEMSYKEIAEAISAPIGTVMSRLARARARLQECLTSRLKGVRV